MHAEAGGQDGYRPRPRGSWLNYTPAARLIRGAVLFVCLALAGQARAQPVQGAPIRVDELRHGSLDRVVVWLTPSAGLSVRQDGDALVIATPSATRLAPTAQPGRDATASGSFGQWVRGLQSAPGIARLALAPGAHPRIRPLTGKTWIDVDGGTPRLLPGQFVPATLEHPAAPAVPPPPLVIPARKDGPPPELAPDSAHMPNPAAAPEQPQAGASVTILTEGAALGGPSILLPLPNAAVASFTRAGTLHVVFDTTQLLDVGALKDDPVFGSATESLLPDGSELRLHPPANVQPVLIRRQSGWVLTLAAGMRPFAPFVAHAAKGVLTFAAASPGRVVALEDESSGSWLWAGTQHQAGLRVLTGHAAPEFGVLPSWQGLILIPHADRLRLRSVAAGFELAAADPPALALDWQNGGMAIRADGQPMTRRFGFDAATPPALRQRMREAQRDAAQAPRSARTEPRVRLAGAMLASGLDVEAGAVLHVAASDDPAAAASIDVQALSAISAWLSARAGGISAPAPGFDPAALGDSDEAMVWRALWSADADPAVAASQLAARWPLLLDYPAGLTRAMVPAIADVLGRGRQEAALTSLLAAFPDAKLDLERAMQMGRLGHAPEALRMLDRLSQGNDRLLRARASERAVELRLAQGQCTPTQAAQALDRQLYAWRDDARELRLRQRIAALLTQAGKWRQALALLRGTETLYPAAQADIHQAEVAVVAGLLQDGRADRLNALDLVALADEASRLLGTTGQESALAPLLADKLLGLDLPNQAEPILRRLLQKAPAGPARAKLGVLLAGLQAESGRAAEAIATLDASQADPLAGDVAQSRMMLKAALLARTGHDAEALALLDGQASGPALDLQARLREDRKDWAAAGHALEQWSRMADFAQLPQAAQRETVLRALRDEVEAGDMGGVRRWRAAGAKLFEKAPNAALFAVLTAEPVRQLADISRAGQELGAMRQLPASLSMASVRP